MSIFRAHRPSAALVVSIIALIASLGGSSYAAFSLPNNSVGTKQLKNGGVTTNKLKNGAVTKAKLNVTGLTVPNAVHANSANTAGSATNAKHADAATHASTADSASSVAYAHILPNGSLDVAHSKNVSAASKVGQGVYCLKTAGAMNNATATVDISSSAGKAGLAVAVLSNEDPQFLVGTYCPSGHNALVGSYDTSGAISDRAFWITFN